MTSLVEEPSPVVLSEPLLEAFARRFGGAPTHAVWSPGRVNLIGEHTDYNHLPVLPMAVGHGLTFAVRANDLGRIRIANVDSRFEPVEFAVGSDILKGAPGDWGNYVKAPVQFMAEEIRQAKGECRGFDAVVDSTLPRAAGLSSSSALVVGVYTCLAAANGFEADPREIAEKMRLSERYVGTASGGMDQATIVLGREGRALKIDFAPLRTREVRVPEEAVFFAVDSLERAEKSGRARYHYNRRVFECHVAARLVAERLADSPLASEDYPSLAQVYHELVRRGIPPMAALLESSGTEAMSFAALRERLGSRLDFYLGQALLPPPEEAVWNGFAGFLPFLRAAHVFNETERVERCAAALDSGDIAAAARELEASHASCRDLYHISTPTLERLVADARACGARAARVTGAGFGGSIVVLVDAAEAPGFRERLWARHYEPRLGGAAGGPAADSVILECRPSRGACARPL